MKKGQMHRHMYRRGGIGCAVLAVTGTYQGQQQQPGVLCLYFIHLSWAGAQLCTAGFGGWFIVDGWMRR